MKTYVKGLAVTAVAAMLIVPSTWAKAESAPKAQKGLDKGKSKVESLKPETDKAKGRFGGKSLRDMPMGRGKLPGMGGALAGAEMSEEQKQAASAAQDAYDAAQAQALDGLVTAGVLTQAQADALSDYHAQLKTARNIDYSQWTVEKYQAYIRAMRGDDWRSALSGFATDGLLTQAQADALITTRTGMGVNIDDMTVAQLREYRKAAGMTGAERAQAFAKLVNDGVLTQAQADLIQAQSLLAQIESGRVPSTLTEQQKAAWTNAQTALMDAQKAYMEAIGALAPEGAFGRGKLLPGHGGWGMRGGVPAPANPGAGEPAPDPSSPDQSSPDPSSSDPSSSDQDAPSATEAPVPEAGA